jgi:hypothetical protein
MQAAAAAARDCVRKRSVKNDLCVALGGRRKPAGLGKDEGEKNVWGVKKMGSR